MLVPATAPLLPNGETPITNNQILRSQAYLFAVNSAADRAKDAVLGSCVLGAGLLAPAGTAVSTGSPFLDWLSGLFAGLSPGSASIASGSPFLNWFSGLLPAPPATSNANLTAPQANNGGSTGPAAGVAAPSPAVLSSASSPGSQAIISRRVWGRPVANGQPPNTDSTLTGGTESFDSFSGGGCSVADSAPLASMSGLWAWIQNNPGWAAAIAFAGVAVLSNRRKR